MKPSMSMVVSFKAALAGFSSAESSYFRLQVGQAFASDCVCVVIVVVLVV
jgi:hypothetical protein